jgi:hypothetical protein
VSAALHPSDEGAILDDERIALLHSSIPKVEAVIAGLSGSGKSYFEDLLWLAKAVLNACEEA